MYGIFAKLVHLKLRERLSKLALPTRQSEQPKSWKRVEFKEYTRMPQVALPADADAHQDALASLLHARKTRRSFAHTTLTLEELTKVLARSAGIRNKDVEDDGTRRTYPSGGARYPLELYVVNFRTEGLESGLYHYNVRKEALEQLAGPSVANEVKGCIPPWGSEASAIVVATAVWERNFRKYQDFGYCLILMEVGHLTQNIQLVAESLGLAYCSFVAGSSEGRVDELLDIGWNRDEHSLYLTALGKRHD